MQIHSRITKITSKTRCQLYIPPKCSCVNYSTCDLLQFSLKFPSEHFFISSRIIIIIILTIMPIYYDTINQLSLVNIKRFPYFVKYIHNTFFKFKSTIVQEKAIFLSDSPSVDFLEIRLRM